MTPIAQGQRNNIALSKTEMRNHNNLQSSKALAIRQQLVQTDECEEKEMKEQSLQRTTRIYD